MALYHFLENTKVYLQVSSGLVHKLDITPEGVKFSQTFTEKTFNQKTLQSQSSLVKQGVFKRANPASFSFTLPLLKENDFDFVFNLLVDLNSSNNLDSFNLFFINENKVFTLETCVFQSGNFLIDKTKPLAIQLSGAAAKLVAAKSSINIVDSNGVVDLSNVTQKGGLTFTNDKVQSRSATRTFLPLTEAQVQFSSEYGTTGGASQHSLFSCNLELQNSIQWVKTNTLLDSINTTDSSNIVYPSSFVLKGRSLAGNCKFYMPTEDDTNFVDEYNSGLNQKFVENQKFTLSAFSRISGVNYGIQFSDTVNYTSRVSSGPFYAMDLDYRLSSNTNTISNILTYTTA